MLKVLLAQRVLLVLKALPAQLEQRVLKALQALKALPVQLEQQVLKVLPVLKELRGHRAIKV